MLKEALLSSVTTVDPFCETPYFGNMGAGSLDTYQLLLAVKKVKAIPDVTVGNGSETSVDLSDYFYKTDVLTYSLTTQGVIEISLKDSILTIKGISKGSTVIRITDGNQSVRTINVTVE